MIGRFDGLRWSWISRQEAVGREASKHPTADRTERIRVPQSRLVSQLVSGDGRREDGEIIAIVRQRLSGAQEFFHVDHDRPRQVQAPPVQLVGFAARLLAATDNRRLVE